MFLLRKAVLLCVVTCLCCTPLMAEDPAPWSTYMDRAEYLMSLGRYPEARSMYQNVCSQFPGTVAVDRAVVGISKTHLAEEDYRGGISYLEDVLTKSSDIESKTEARQLYCNMESAFRNARTRATRHYTAIEQEYDDISWWNIFKIFKKLDLRGDLKEAEKDLQELSDLHNLFNPSLLLPSAYADSPVEPIDGEADDGEADEDEADDDEADDGEADDGEADEDEADEDEADEDEADEDEADEDEADEDEADEEEDMSRDLAYEVLEEDIARLISLIPDEKIADASAVISGEVSEETTVTAPVDSKLVTESAVGSALSTDTSDDQSVGGVITTTETIDEEASDVIGEGDSLVTISEDETGATTETAEESTSEGSIVATTATASSPSTTVTTQMVASEDKKEETSGPAAPTGTIIKDERESSPTVKSVAELKRDYIAAYQDYVRATQSGDPAEVQAAMEAYRQAREAYNEGQVRDNSVSTGGGTGGTNGNGSAENGGASPSAPVGTPSAATGTLPDGTPVSSGAVLSTDRIGRVRVGDRNSDNLNSRVGLQP